MIYSIQTGKARLYADENGLVFSSAGVKDTYYKRIFISKNGLEGDMVSDIKHHDIEDKAVFANALGNYFTWENFLGRSLSYGDMGENLTIKGIDEENVFIGDIHRLGLLTLQVSAPKRPYANMDKIHKNKNLTKFLFNSGLTGWCYRVLEAGSCKVDEVIKIEKSEKVRLSILELNKLLYNPKKHPELYDKFSKLKTIDKTWQDMIEKRLNESCDTFI